MNANQMRSPNFVGIRGLLFFWPFSTTPPSTKEMYKMFGLLFANAVSPKPQFPFWFKNSSESHIFGNDFFANALDKKLPGGRAIKDERRWKHFRIHLGRAPQELPEVLDTWQVGCHRWANYWVQGCARISPPHHMQVRGRWLSVQHCLWRLLHIQLLLSSWRCTEIAWEFQGPAANS